MLHDISDTFPCCRVSSKLNQLIVLNIDWQNKYNNEPWVRLGALLSEGSLFSEVRLLSGFISAQRFVSLLSGEGGGEGVSSEVYGVP